MTTAVATHRVPIWVVVVLLTARGSPVVPAPGESADRPLVMAVSDPLAAELSCPCVAGYAQRDYEVLAEHIAAAVGRDVKVVFGDSIATAVGGDAEPADIVIGKRSVMRVEAERSHRLLKPVAELTDLEGSTTQRGFVVVRRDDAAQGIAALHDHTIVLGPADCEEKNAAARRLFARNHGDTPHTFVEAAGCTEAAERVLAARRVGGPPIAAVISSYAAPLLEGCGTIRKGDLRVVAETAPVPFITAFIDDGLDPETRRTILDALRAVADEPGVRLAIESKQGFKMLVGAERDTSSWPGWRGHRRDAVVARLPDRLPDPPRILWTCPLFNEGVGGVAVADGFVLVGDRDAEDERDVFHAIDVVTGARVWTLEYVAPGHLDYGNSPRATPLVHGDHAYLLGAFGHLHCVRLADGEVVWRRHLREDFAVTGELVWGVSSSPLIVDEKLIVNPGSAAASLVALDPATGKIVWQAPGAPAAYASFVVAAPDGVEQLVGYDAESCGGWDIATGKRLWSLAPKVAGDFNVPTPLVIGSQTLFVSENNGARAIALDASGKPRVAAACARLDPDMHSPVACNGRIFGVHKGRVTCLEADTLEMVWEARDRSLGGHASLVASPERVLMCTQEGELVLINARADRLDIVSRCRVLDGEASTLAHPAVADGKLFVRGPRELLCIDLSEDEAAAR